RRLDETARLTVRSEAAFRATGCWGVAEGAALAAAGPGGALIVRRCQLRRATCAIARAPMPLDAAAIGRPRGRLAIIGIGPGDPAWRTPEASALLAASDDVVGYRLYLDLRGRARRRAARPRFLRDLAIRSADALARGPRPHRGRGIGRFCRCTVQSTLGAARDTARRSRRDPPRTPAAGDARFCRAQSRTLRRNTAGHAP